jgi:hypothetical protein
LLVVVVACHGAPDGDAPDAPVIPADAGAAGDAPADGASASSSALVIAFEAPNPTDTAHYDAFLTNVLPHISGIGVPVSWAAIDNCGAAPCANEDDFSFDIIDRALDQYITNPITPFASGCAGGRPCQIVLIVQPTTDSGNNNRLTPAYVFSPDYAASLGAPPQDVAICKNMEGAAAGWPGGPPITGTFGPTDFATWNANGGSIVAGSGLAIQAGAFPTKNFSGYPVIYEAPFAAAYRHFLAALLAHYSAAGHGDGHTIAQYLAYIRIGFHGGEDDPACSAGGQVPSTPWTAGGAFAAGALVRPASGNAGGYYYVADGDGTAANAPPAWCQTAACDTGADGSIAGWRNTGYAKSGAGSKSFAVWPAPDGTPNGFSDATYTGFVHGIYAVAVAQQGGIALDVASHDGPPSNGNWSYADSAAVAAAHLGVGFGNEGLSVLDEMMYEQHLIPSARHDWIENFAVLANAPGIRHLQMYWPGGGGVQSEAFAIDHVDVAAGAATVHCTSDCSVYCTGSFIPVITGAGASGLDGPQQVMATTCAASTVTFAAPNVADGTYTGGMIFASDYVPEMIPFGTSHGGNAIELHECTLDYAYGAVTVGTAAKSCSGLPGPDASYQAAIAAAIH